MRLFTAIGASDISFSPETAFKKVKVNLLKKEIEHRWVPRANYHCTLNFLGEVENEKVSVLEAILHDVASTHSAFELKLQGVDAFPETSHGRVLYVGVQNSKHLRSLQEELSSALKANDFLFEERPYVPHLTIARLRNPRNLIDTLSPVKNQNFGTVAVHKVSLFESKSGGAFPVYKELMNVPLKPYLPMNDEINLM